MFLCQAMMNMDKQTNWQEGQEGINIQIEQ